MQLNGLHKILIQSSNCVFEIFYIFKFTIFTKNNSINQNGFLFLLKINNYENHYH